MAQPLLVQGRVVAMNANAEDFPQMAGIKPEAAEKKISAIHEGAELQQEHPPMPDARACQDVLWLGLFVVAVIATLGLGISSSEVLIKKMSAPNTTGVQHGEDDAVTMITGATLGAIVGAASVGSLIAALAFIKLAHVAPACVVWTSLIFGPALMIGMGFAMLLSGNVIALIMGCVFIMLGMCSLAGVFCCWRHLVPFMIQMTETVSEVIEQHPCMIAVGVIGTILGACWTLAAGLSFVSIYYNYESQIDLNNKGVKYGVVFVCVLIFTWGGGVAHNICHVTYCGVFGRWYYKNHGSDSGSGSDAGDDNTLFPSFKTAITTSLGSICLGSLLVALVRAAEAVARQAKQDAQDEGNMVLCVVACVIEVFISCIGDILEYFNDWAYVQCAVRGVSFCQAAKITYSMMTCANVQYILSDLLLDSLITMGSFIVGFVGCGCGAITGFVLQGGLGAAWGGIVGFFIGFIAGGAALGIINSGVKTILACWADDPDSLKHSHPEVHAAFQERLQMNYQKQWGVN